MSERVGSDSGFEWRYLQSILSRSRNSSIYFTVVLCRIRLFPTLISKISWLESAPPLKCPHPGFSGRWTTLNEVFHQNLVDLREWVIVPEGWSRKYTPRANVNCNFWRTNIILSTCCEKYYDPNIKTCQKLLFHFLNFLFNRENETEMAYRIFGNCIWRSKYCLDDFHFRWLKTAI